MLPNYLAKVNKPFDFLKVNTIIEIRATILFLIPRLIQCIDYACLLSVLREQLSHKKVAL
jgi:hypothetical protein